MINTRNSGFSFFWRAELKDILNWCKSCFAKFASLNTTTIVNNSGPPPEGGTPIAAVSRTLLSTSLHMRSISTELTCPLNMKCQITLKVEF